MFILRTFHRLSLSISHAPNEPNYITNVFDAICYITVQAFNSCTSRLRACQCLVVHTCRPMDNMSKNKPSLSMTHAACGSKVKSDAIHVSIYPYPENRLVIRRAVVYYAWAAHLLSEIKCRHCMCVKDLSLVNDDCAKLYIFPQ